MFVQSPAKLNLFLHITGQRDDGYHLLQSAFQLIDLCDEMHFELTHDGIINLETDLIELNNADNLVIKAAHQLRYYATPSYGCKIKLIKNIPLGSGLGGGSSNAATTLLILNKLWQLDLSKNVLSSLALELGADVPFFIHGTNAWVEGIGENIFPITLPECYYVVSIPSCHISTAAIFKHPELTRNTPHLLNKAFFSEMGRNDCQHLVCSLYPEVKNVIEQLHQFAPARLSGTGSSVFARFEQLELAEAATKAMNLIAPTFLCKGLNHSPVITTIDTYPC